MNSGVVNIFSTEYAFAALKNDGSVVAWGNSSYGGDSSSVSAYLNSGVVNIFSTERAFAALKNDGSVVAWGYISYGGDSSSVSAYLNSGVQSIYPLWWGRNGPNDANPASSPITNSICFAKGTIISTDQGKVEIQNIVPGKHTIGEKAICHITKTISPEKKIVCVKKNAFGKNKPNKAITMSGNHCIKCEKGAMVKAKELVANNRNMKFVEYNKEPLYNVLMEDHNVIKVQNLEVETLDPENIVAKIYNSIMDKSILAKLVKQMNEGIMENNREKYIIAEETLRKG